VMAERIEGLVASHEQLLRDVSHELRSPLARIRVAIALVQQQAAHEEGQPIDAALLARIEREVERLESLIGQVLTLSRLETSSGSAKWERIDIGELVQAVVEDAQFEAAGKGSEVRFERGPELRMHGEASILRSAIENVVRNAIRASGPGSPVEIELAGDWGTEDPGDSGDSARAGHSGAEPTHAVIHVMDRGPGVPDEELETIFEPFTRGEKSRDRHSGGSGLGLAIARRAIESHGGRIRAHRRDGGGLVVWMRVPLAKANVEGPEEPDGRAM